MRFGLTLVGLLTGLAACSFDAPGNGGANPDGRVDSGVDAPAGQDAPDGPQVTPDGMVIDAPPSIADVAHLDDTMLAGSAANCGWSAAVTIDTANLTTSLPLTSGAVFHAIPQQGGGPELAVLECATFTQTAALAIVGTRPLVIVASNSISLTAEVDASAHGTTGGPGSQTTGAGVGGTPTHMGSYSDGGGGGGGYGSVGAAGGTATQGTNIGKGGSGGAVSGTADLARLQGGAAGGPGLPATGCHPGPALGGGGGGALQLSAGASIQVAGMVYLDGGGGDGGRSCDGNMGSAGGGGSGGALYLEAPVVTMPNAAHLAGGGGGGGSNWNNMPPGVAGDDGKAGRQGGDGGAAKLPDGAAGGIGSVGGAAATAGSSVTSTYPNGGGGGGGRGRSVTVITTN